MTLFQFSCLQVPDQRLRSLYFHIKFNDGVEEEGYIGSTKWLREVGRWSDLQEPKCPRIEPIRPSNGGFEHFRDFVRIVDASGELEPDNLVRHKHNVIVIIYSPFASCNFGYMYLFNSSLPFRIYACSVSKTTKQR